VLFSGFTFNYSWYRDEIFVKKEVQWRPAARFPHLSELVSGPWPNSGEIPANHSGSGCRIPPTVLNLLEKTLRRMAWIEASWVRTAQLHLILYWQQVVNVDGSAWLSQHKAQSPLSISSCVVAGELFGYMCFFPICRFN